MIENKRIAPPGSVSIHLQNLNLKNMYLEQSDIEHSESTLFIKTDIMLQIRRGNRDNRGTYFVTFH